jgi:hypothetical protein
LSHYPLGPGGLLRPPPATCIYSFQTFSLHILFNIFHQAAGSDELLHKFGDRLGLVGFVFGDVFYHAGCLVDFDLVAFFDLLGCFGAFKNGQAAVEAVAEEYPREALGDDATDLVAFDRERGMFTAGTAAEVFAGHDYVAGCDFVCESPAPVFHAVDRQFLYVGCHQVSRRYNDVGVDIVSEFKCFAVQFILLIATRAIGPMGYYYITSSGSVILPVRALAAAMAGFAR